jgi:predicted phosphodiesterase
MNERKPSSKYILALLKRFPNTPTLTLAKKAYKEEPKLFKSLDSARSAIRMYRGSIGGVNRIKVINKEFFVKPKESTNPFNLPESHSKKQNVWRLPKAAKKILLISDLHIPYHDINAITTAIKTGANEGVDTVFINGDLLDFYQLSFHEKDPRKRSIADELEDCRQFFNSLRTAMPKVNIYYIPGNHEYRLERYLRVKAPELLDVEEFRLDVLLRVAEYGVEYISYASKCYFGKLLVEHGDKIKGAGGVNPARTLYLRLKRHAICGHFHRSTESTEKVYDGDVYVTYSVGCLCELEPGYMEVNNHNHGFAIITMDGDKFTVSNRKIVNGKVY